MVICFAVCACSTEWFVLPAACIGAHVVTHSCRVLPCIVCLRQLVRVCLHQLVLQLLLCQTSTVRLLAYAESGGLQNESLSSLLGTSPCVEYHKTSPGQPKAVCEVCVSSSLLHHVSPQKLPRAADPASRRCFYEFRNQCVVARTVSWYTYSRLKYDVADS